jgi:hypothetical protein
MDFKLKGLSKTAIPAALERAERYRLLNEPVQAESICLDVLAADSDNQQAIILLLLSLSDQFTENIPDNLDRAWSLLPRLKDEYLRAYYQGLLFERQARVYMRRASPGSGFSAYDLFCDAMKLYEKAEGLRPHGNDEALLRWNTCARTIMSSRLQPRPIDDFRPMLE